MRLYNRITKLEEHIRVGPTQESEAVRRGIAAMSEAELTERYDVLFSDVEPVPEMEGVDDPQELMRQYNRLFT